MGTPTGRSVAPRSNGIIRAVLASRTTAAALLPLLLLVAGCEFWFPPEPEPPDPNADGVLRCGDVEVLDGYAGGQALIVDVARDQGVELFPDYDDPSHGSRLAISSDTDLRRILEIWDPVSGRRVLAGRRGIGETLQFEMVTPGGEATSGTLEVACVTPGEVCSNLYDDDGDGWLDCADLGCARNPGCMTDQQNLEEITLSCSSGFVPLTPPELASLDDQRTIYATRPGQDGEPLHEFWGGAELVITGAEGSGEITLRFEGEGLVCHGTDLIEVVDCDAPVYVEPGQDYTWSTADLPLFLEPLDVAWPGLSADLDCAGG